MQGCVYVTSTRAEMCSPSVPMLIGRGGTCINGIKAACGCNMSFTKKNESCDGQRKLYVTGTISGVAQCIFVCATFMQQNESPGGPSMGLVVADGCAGLVIGKGGANLKSLREDTNCSVHLAKREECHPGLGGRRLTVSSADSAFAVATACYRVLRLPGFTSADRHQQPTHAQASGGMGQMGGMGAMFGSDPNICSIHGKKRGQNNLQPHPTMPGQNICRPDDECKGSFAASPYAGLMASMGMGAQGMGALAGMPGMPGMEVEGMQQYGQPAGGMDPYMLAGLTQDYAQPAAAGYGPVAGSRGGARFNPYGAAPVDANVCATHGKRRGPRNLAPNALGQMVCLPNDQCKTGFGGGDGGAGAAQAGGAGDANMCSVHGKRRGARNLQPNPLSPGLFVCMDHDVCK